MKWLARVPHLHPGGRGLQICPLGALEIALALLGACGSLISAGLHPSSSLCSRQSCLVLSSLVKAIVWHRVLGVGGVLGLGCPAIQRPSLA